MLNRFILIACVMRVLGQRDACKVEWRTSTKDILSFVSSLLFTMDKVIDNKFEAISFFVARVVTCNIRAIRLALLERDKRTFCAVIQ